MNGDEGTSFGEIPLEQHCRADTPTEASGTLEAGEALAATPVEKVDIIPNGGYGWVNVACLFAQNSVTWGESPIPSLHHRAQSSL